MVLYNTLPGAIGGAPFFGDATWLGDSFSTDGNSYLLTNITLYVFTQTAYAGGPNAYLYSSGFAGPTPYPLAELESIGSYNDNALPGSEEQPVSFNGADYALAPNTTYWIVAGGTGSQFADDQWEDPTGPMAGTGEISFTVRRPAFRPPARRRAMACLPWKCRRRSFPAAVARRACDRGGPVDRTHGHRTCGEGEAVPVTPAARFVAAV